MNVDEAREICQVFANKHKVIFDDEGECGFGRECVGFNYGGAWVDHNPYDHGTYDEIPEYVCEVAYPPNGVDAYHKHDCLAVLGRGDDAIMQLAKWVQHMEEAGEVEIVEYATGATGMQAMLTGVTSKTVMIRPRDESNKEADDGNESRA